MLQTRVRNYTLSLGADVAGTQTNSKLWLA